MNFLKRMFSKQIILLEIELSISNSSYCKVIGGNSKDDFHIMLLSLLVYARVLNLLTELERTRLTNFFIELHEASKASNMSIAELLNLVTNSSTSSNSKTRIKLIQQENGIKTLDVGTLYNTDLGKYATLIFGFVLGKCSESNRPNIFAAFVTLSKICNNKKLTAEESITYPYQILDSVINN